MPCSGQRGIPARAYSGPQIVVNLGNGADGGARIVRGGFLFNGNGRRQPLDVIHVGLFHQRQELPGVGRQRLDVAALALGVQRVEGQRELPEPNGR